VLLVGYQTRIVALIVAAFTLATLWCSITILPTEPDDHLFKNIAIVGGLLQVAPSRRLVEPRCAPAARSAFGREQAMMKIASTASRRSCPIRRPASRRRRPTMANLLEEVQVADRVGGLDVSAVGEHPRRVSGTRAAIILAAAAARTTADPPHQPPSRYSAPPIRSASSRNSRPSIHCQGPGRRSSSGVAPSARPFPCRAAAEDYDRLFAESSTSS